MLLSSPNECDKTYEIIDSQENGQDGRSTDVVMRIVLEEEEEEYLPH